MLSFLLVIACVFDYGIGKIPNFLQFNIMSIGLIYSYCCFGYAGIAWFILKVLVVGIVFFPMYALAMIGAGDVKMIALASTFFVSERIVWFVFISLIIATPVSLIKLLMDKEMISRVGYFFNYVAGCIRNRQISPYHADKRDQVKYGIEMSGPVLLSVLLAIGGVY